MKKATLIAVLIVLMSCHKEADSPLGNTLFRWALYSYSGPDTQGKTIYAKDEPKLRDDGMLFKAIPNVSGYPQKPYTYEGTIYQGPLKYWQGKPDFTFEVTYIDGKTMKLGNDQTGYNLAFYDGAGETLTIDETYPVKGRKYVFEKTSD